MSKNLSQLLGRQPSEVSYVLHKFESLSGYHSEDNKLLSEIRTRLWSKMAELDLDPADTTHNELYHSIQARYINDSQNFSNLIGTAGLSSVDKTNAALVELISAMGLAENTWVLKRKAAKDLLSKHLPKKLMKYLNYRSLSSMLKREDISEIYAALPLLESSVFMKSLKNDLAKLKASDFEIRKLEIIDMPSARWGIIKPKSAVTKSDILGSVFLWPANHPSHNDLTSFIKIVMAVEDIELNNLGLMNAQVSPNFSDVLENYVKNGSSTPKLRSAFSLYWHNIAHFYHYLPASLNSFLGEPHMQEVKMRRLSPARHLSSVHPIFAWWKDNDYLGANSSLNPISFNLADAAENIAKSNEFEYSTFRHLKHNIWNELLARYMAHPQLESEVANMVDKGHYDIEVPSEEINQSLISRSKVRQV